jgi:hypothetical protein
MALLMVHIYDVNDSIILNKTKHHLIVGKWDYEEEKQWRDTLLRIKALNAFEPTLMTAYVNRRIDQVFLLSLVDRC